MRLRPPSPALVVACLALAISLSGTAYAVSTTLPRNSVGTLQLKNNSVNSAKVKNASLRAADFAPGQIPTGPQGPAGPQGPPGTAGLQLISGSGASNSSSPKSQQQDCPAGKRAVGGGGVITGSAINTFLSTSRPTDAGDRLGRDRTRVEWGERRQLGRADLGRVRDGRVLGSAASLDPGAENVHPA
jgi:hypothetical protein